MISGLDPARVLALDAAEDSRGVSGRELARDRARCGDGRPSLSMLTTEPALRSLRWLLPAAPVPPPPPPPPCCSDWSDRTDDRGRVVLHEDGRLIRRRLGSQDGGGAQPRRRVADENHVAAAAAAAALLLLLLLLLLVLHVVHRRLLLLEEHLLLSLLLLSALVLLLVAPAPGALPEPADGGEALVDDVGLLLLTRPSRLALRPRLLLLLWRASLRTGAGLLRLQRLLRALRRSLPAPRAVEHVELRDGPAWALHGSLVGWCCASRSRGDARSVR